MAQRMLSDGRWLHAKRTPVQQTEQHMAVVYEYWQHRETGVVWAVKLVHDHVAGAVNLSPRDVESVLLEHLPYRAVDAAAIQRSRDDFRRIDGRHIA